MKRIICGVALIAFCSLPALASGAKEPVAPRASDAVKSERMAPTPRGPEKIIDMGEGELI